MKNKKQFSTSQTVKALGFAAITIAITLLVPVSIPFVGILFVIAGSILSRRSSDKNERVFWNLVLGVGILMCLATLIVLLTQIRIR